MDTYISELAEFKYYAVFHDDKDVPDLDKAYMVIRRHEAYGYAMFHQLTDVLDLDAAYAVVQELRPECRFSVRLAAHETETLTARVFLRKARRTAEPVDGFYYFAEFSSTKDMLDLGLARSVSRCTAGDNNWETFLREQEWLPASNPVQRNLLPIGRAEVEQVTHRLSVDGIRFFEIRGPDHPIALTRLTGDTEATDTPGGWKPSDLLRRWRDEPKWSIVDKTMVRKDGSGFWHPYKS